MRYKQLCCTIDGNANDINAWQNVANNRRNCENLIDAANRGNPTNGQNLAA